MSNPYDYQAALALAGGQAAGLNVGTVQAQVVGAITPQVSDPDTVEKMVDLFTMTNQEKAAYWNEQNPGQQIAIPPVSTTPYTPGERTQNIDIGSLAPTLFTGGAAVAATPVVWDPFSTPDTGRIPGPMLQPAIDTAGMPNLSGLSGVWDQITGMLPDNWGSWLGAIGTGLGIYNLATGALSGDNGGSSGLMSNGGNGMASGTTAVSVSGGTSVGGVSFGGPGVPEPPASMVAKAWKTKSFSNTVGEYWVYFWKLTDGRILCWNAAKREAKIWRPKKPIVMYRGKVTLSQAVKTQRMLDKLWRTVAKKTKQLKLA